MKIYQNLVENGMQNNITFIIRSMINFHETPSTSYNFRISRYATASTSESVLIIGGYTSEFPYTSTIAEYKDGNWKNIGNLAQARHHVAITSGPITMVVGGYAIDGGP